MSINDVDKDSKRKVSNVKFRFVIPKYLWRDIFSKMRIVLDKTPPPQIRPRVSCWKSQGGRNLFLVGSLFEILAENFNQKSLPGSERGFFLQWEKIASEKAKFKTFNMAKELKIFKKSPIWGIFTVLGCLFLDFLWKFPGGSDFWGLVSLVSGFLQKIGKGGLYFLGVLFRGFGGLWWLGIL